MAVHAPGRHLTTEPDINLGRTHHSEQLLATWLPNMLQVDIREGMEVHRDWFNAAGSKKARRSTELTSTACVPG